MLGTVHGTWGVRERIWGNSSALTTVLRLEPNKRCSWHYHNTAYNLFYVVSGELGVKTDKGHTTRVQAGQQFTAEPGEKHEFQTYDYPATVVEIAYVEFNEHDIHRLSLGGELNDENDQEGS